MKELKSILGKINLDFKVLRKEQCECGEVEIVEVALIGGKNKGQKITEKRGCKCWEKEINKQIEEQYLKRQRKSLYEKFRMHSLMNEKLKNCTFDNYIPKNKTQELALEVALDYVKNYNKHESRNLLFSGLYGLGKSHLSVCIVRELMVRKNASCIFTSVPKLLTMIKSTFQKNSEMSELELLNALEDVDVLVLDDIGAEKDTDWTTEKIFELIDNRAGKHTIYTTNLVSKELNKKIGERNFSRLIMDTEIVHIVGEDNREKTFKKWSV